MSFWKRWLGLEAKEEQENPSLDEASDNSEQALLEETTSVSDEAQEEPLEESVESDASQEADPEVVESPLEEHDTEETDINSDTDQDNQRPSSFWSKAWQKTKDIALMPVDPWFEGVVSGLSKTRKSFTNKLAALLRIKPDIDEDFWEELEEIFITSDVGLDSVDRIMDGLRERAMKERITAPKDLLQAVYEILRKELVGDPPLDRDLNLDDNRLNVILMVGVNGAGKTTSTAKLAHLLRRMGYRVMLAAADTFRAAAVEQLVTWAERHDFPVVRQGEGADPAAVVYDALESAQAKDYNVLIVDTAGRLHSKLNLMKELDKIRRIIEKKTDAGPHESLLVFDATNGQNAMRQAEKFSEDAHVTGAIAAKLDGSAKGGVIIGLANQLKIPVKFIGIGEGIDDLQPFDPDAFLQALLTDMGSIADERSSVSDEANK